MIDNFRQIYENIRRHYVNAVEKHPLFCNKFIPEPKPNNWIDWKALAKNEKNLIQFYVKIGECNSKQILMAEIYEIFAAYAKGKYEQAEYEIYDAIAVLLRMLDMIREMQKE